MNTLRISFVMALLAVAGCSASLGNGDDLGQNLGNQALALRSSTGEQGVLRFGDTLNIQIGDLAELDPSTMYRFRVTGSGGANLSEGDVRTGPDARLLLANVMYDVGEDGRVADGATLGVELLDRGGALITRSYLTLDTLELLQVPGWNVEEVAPPHIFAATADGAPANAFAVGGQDPGETVGPVYIAGEGFPDAVAGETVAVYVARDRDEWRGRAIPQAGSAEYVAGPIAVRVDTTGVLTPTELFTPDLRHAGIYDILVDVNNDGTFEWSFSSKDGADGLGNVGFTVQYSQAWFRARTESHILVNLAYSSHQRDSGTWENSFTSAEQVFAYMNPPVMHTYHFSVTKWFVRHQDFDTFWNNPAVAEADGAVNFAEFAIQDMDGPTQTGCTNGGPVCFGVVDLPVGVDAAEFDAVWDRNGDGRYMPGEDILDVIGGTTGGDLVSVADFLALPASQRHGFSVTRAR